MCLNSSFEPGKFILIASHLIGRKRSGAYRSSLEIIRTDGNRALVKGSEAEVRRLNKISKGRILFSPVTPHPREKVK